MTSGGSGVPSQSISNEFRLYRRVPDFGSSDFVVIDQATGNARPTTGSFDFDPDASVYCRETLSSIGLNWRALVLRPLNEIYELLALEIRTEFPIVTHTPYPDGKALAQPAYEFAHCSVWPNSESVGARKKRVRRLMKLARWVSSPQSATQAPTTQS